MIPRPAPMPRLLTGAEVEGLFGVTARTITRWINAGRIKPIRTPGGHRRFREAEIRALLAAQQEDDQ